MKLTLRDLFWLVLVSAMAMGWWLHHRHQVGVEAESAEALRSSEERLRSTNELFRAVLAEGNERMDGDRRRRMALRELTEYLRARGITWGWANLEGTAITIEDLGPPPLYTTGDVID